MPSWYLIRKSGNFTETGARHGIPAAAARLMVNRGIDTDEKIEKYLHGSLKDMHDPGLMKDMDGAKIELSVTNNGETADIAFTATALDGTVHNQSYKGIAISGDLYYTLGVECACLDIVD